MIVQNMITPQLAAEILALSVIVVPITQAIKKWVKAQGTTALIISAVVTILLSLWRVLSVQALRLGKVHHSGSGGVFRGKRNLLLWFLRRRKNGEEGRVKDVEREQNLL